MDGTDTPDDPNAPAPAPTSDAVKSMGLFFIDNQGIWPEGAVLAGDLVLWPDDGKYPAFAPVAAATHPNYDGTVVVQAGNRGLVISFCAGARDGAAVRKSMSAKGDAGPEQYRIAVDGIVQRIMLWRAGKEKAEGRTDVHPFALLEWMCKANPREAAILQKALLLLLAKPEPIVYQANPETHKWVSREEMFEEVEAMLDQLKVLVIPELPASPLSQEAPP